MNDLPSITTEEELDAFQTTPRPVLVEYITKLQSPLVILGGGGKMGPSLAVLAKRAADEAGCSLDILSISRFSNQKTSQWLEKQGVRTISLDLLDHTSYPSLPDAANIIYLVGLKFGTIANPSITWATNTLVPSFTCERYPQAKIAALSSGNVYPVTSVHGPGSFETDPLNPIGEYSNSCVARERIFEYYSQVNQTQIALIRLSYAIDLRYGVLHDIATNVQNEVPVALANGSLNCIWQGDANEMIIRALALAQSPAYAVNLTGKTWYSVRDLGERFARMFGKEARFSGAETGSALLSNTTRMVETLGDPPTSMEHMLHWTGEWVKAGGQSLNKPTHFEVRDGKY